MLAVANRAIRLDDMTVTLLIGWVPKAECRSKEGEEWAHDYAQKKQNIELCHQKLPPAALNITVMKRPPRKSICSSVEELKTDQVQTNHFPNAIREDVTIAKSVAICAILFTSPGNTPSSPNSPAECKIADLCWNRWVQVRNVSTNVVTSIRENKKRWCISWKCTDFDFWVIPLSNCILTCYFPYVRLYEKIANYSSDPFPL